MSVSAQSIFCQPFLQGVLLVQLHLDVKIQLWCASVRYLWRRFIVIILNVIVRWKGYVYRMMTYFRLYISRDLRMRLVAGVSKDYTLFTSTLSVGGTLKHNTVPCHVIVGVVLLVWKSHRGCWRIVWKWNTWLAIAVTILLAAWLGVKTKRDQIFHRAQEMTWIGVTGRVGPVWVDRELTTAACCSKIWDVRSMTIKDYRICCRLSIQVSFFPKARLGILYSTEVNCFQLPCPGFQTLLSL